MKYVLFQKFCSLTLDENKYNPHRKSNAILIKKAKQSEDCGGGREVRSVSY